MEKLQMCRICLAENVRMYLVVNKDLHALYEKLTNIPFITEDSRPNLACYFCCAKLKQCYRFWRKCLEAEELFTQMMDEDYEPDSSINSQRLELCSFTTSPIEKINIIDKHQTKIVSIKEEELPAVCGRPDDDSETNEENQSISLLPDNMCHIFLNVDDILPEHSDSDSDDDIPSMEIINEVEKALEGTNSQAEKEQRAVETNIVTAADAPVTRKRKLEDTTTAESKKNEQSNSKVTRTTRDRRSKPAAVFKEPYKREQRRINRSKKVEENNRTSTGDKPYKSDLSLEPEKLANSNLNLEDKLPEHSESDSEDNVPLMEVTVEVEELKNELPVSRKTRRAVETKSTPTSRAKKLEDINTEEINKNEQSNMTVTRTTRDRRSKPDTVFKEPYKREQRSLNGNKELKPTLTRIDEKPHKCDICQRSFSLKDHLVKHTLTHTGEKPYKCHVCKHRFAQKGHLTKHNRIHTGEKPYKCDICKRCFSVKGSLSQHILTHTGEKPYKCDTCQRTFRQKGGLTNHIRIHTGEKPYKCGVCQRRFRQRTPFKNHILIHAGVKPYKCDVCQHGFSDKATLVKHIRIHTGVKPYKCEICQHTFNQKVNLRNHIRTHTGEKPYKCEVCQRGFCQKAHLIKHMRVHA